MSLFERQIECRACGATGLYVGIAERGGDAVVCHRCKGTGLGGKFSDCKNFPRRGECWTRWDSEFGGSGQ